MAVRSTESPVPVELLEGDQLSIHVNEHVVSHATEVRGNQNHTILLREIADASLDTLTTLRLDETPDSPFVAAFIKLKFAGLSETPLVYLYFRPDEYTVQQVSMMSERDGLKMFESIILEPQQFEQISTPQRQIIGALTPINTLE